MFDLLPDEILFVHLWPELLNDDDDVDVAMRVATTLCAVSRRLYLIVALDEELWRRLALRRVVERGAELRYCNASWRDSTFRMLRPSDAITAAVPTPLSRFRWSDVVLPLARSSAVWRASLDFASSFRFVPPSSAAVRLDVPCELARAVALDASRLRRQPLLLGASAVAQWPAVREQSWRLERLLARFGDVAFTVQRPDGDDDVTTMRFADYVAYARAQCDESPLYVFDRKFHKRVPALDAEYGAPALFAADVDLLRSLDERVRPTLRWLVIGPARTGASWHRDPLSTSAWNTLLDGHKRWALYPPDRVPPGVDVLYENDDAQSGRIVDWQSPPSVYWFAHIYPTLGADERPYIECVQAPHETIYVPAHWWHCVLNLDFTVAVTENFAERSYAADVVREMRAMTDDDKARKKLAPVGEMENNHKHDDAEHAAQYAELIEKWIVENDLDIGETEEDDDDDDDDDEDEDDDDDELRARQRDVKFRGEFERVCRDEAKIEFDGDAQVMLFGQSPVFATKRHVVKLVVRRKFRESLARERAALAALRDADCSALFAQLVACGDSWIVTERVCDAVPLRQIASELSAFERAALAVWCADAVLALRKCGAGQARALDAFVGTISRWRAAAATTHGQLCTLPPLLAAQVAPFVQRYLPSALDDDSVQLLHGDVNDENILMRVGAGGRWHAASLIDFGDSFVGGGDVLFELLAIYCSALRCDVQLMAAFAVRLGLPRVSFASPCALLAYALVHPCDPLATAFQHRGELYHSSSLFSLEQLADALFKL